jgi:catechol 2,3-dioxygenase-like lactoylglutathione lyase family enzyme
MIIGAHIVVASKDAEADHRFFREVLKLDAVDAGGGYLIFGMPAAEASIHPTEGDVPHHELYFLCDDVVGFVSDMGSRGTECGEVTDAGWGQVVEIKLPSGAPLHIYQPRHARPSE